MDLVGSSASSLSSEIRRVVSSLRLRCPPALLLFGFALFTFALLGAMLAKLLLLRLALAKLLDWGHNHTLR